MTLVPADTVLPMQDRKCTDIIWTLVIACLWITMTIIGATSVENGNVDKLLAPLDYEGNLCGHDVGYEDLPNLYYVNTLGSGICIAECPSETDSSTLICRYDVDESLSDEEAILQGYCLVQLESTEIVRYCVFTDSSEWDAVLQSDLSTYFTQYVSDVIIARGYVFGFGLGVASALAFVYIGLLQIPCLVSLVVWAIIAGVLVALMGLGWAALQTAEDWRDAGTKDSEIVNATYAASVFAWVLAFIWLCLFCFLRKRVSLAISIIEKAGKAIAAMPLIMFWPLVELMGSAAFIAIWTYYAAYTASLGDISTKTVTSAGGLDLSYKVYDFDDDVESRGWFLLFALFWTLNFIAAIGQIVVAMAVSSWYWAPNESSVGSCTVVSSAVKTMFYHTGTAAFGGLIIAIMQFVRAILTYIQKKAEASGNTVLKWISCCCICCFWCMEKCMRFISKNAYVHTALLSTSFCTSARNAFSLIAQNIVRMGTVTVLGGFIVNLMTIFVTIVTAVLVYLAMEANISSKLHSLAGPTIMTAILAYFTGKMGASVYGMAVTTILQCFLVQEDCPQLTSSHFSDMEKWVNENGSKPEELPNPSSSRSR